ncbi:MAG: aldehyde dehydrogenase family protein [Deltaproteobacteria bacterium]|nr:MAG: aldehyde dehydrogenase family protein [Deltaproteobacteria bacterium]
MYRRERFFIDGVWQPPASGELVPVHSPASEEPIGAVPRASAPDVDRAVAAARRALESGPWPRMAPAERADWLIAMAAHLAARRGALAELSVDEAGVPVTYARQRENGPIAILDYYARLAREFRFRERRPTATGHALVLREPVGVVAAIVPFNGPLMSAAAKIAPSLAAGCPIVFKPAPETPLDAFALADAAEAVGLPPGVLNILPADREIGERLVSHPGVDRVVFTGSTQGGRRVAQLCAQSFKRVTLELGGKAAAILLGDAPLESALASILPLSFFNSGQACIALSRILAPRDRYDEVVEAVAAAAAELVVGDPRDEKTQQGPLISARQRERVLALIAAGRAEGASLACGGGVPRALDRGHYVEPTVFRGVESAMRIAREEFFGPVVCVIPYRNEDDAVAIANDSPYGLSGAVFTRDVARGVAIAGRIQVGTFGVNGYALDPSLPFGGRKESGIGREFGLEGLAEYTELKAIALPPGFEGNP